MKDGHASQTALRVAIRRAAHQLVDKPPVLDDPIALPLLGLGYQRDLERAMHRVARDFRGFMAARTRYVEDRLADAVSNGLTQYVISARGWIHSLTATLSPPLRSLRLTFRRHRPGNRRSWPKLELLCPLVSRCAAGSGG